MNRQTLAVIDDDLAVRQSLLWLLETPSLAVSGFESAERFLAQGSAAANFNCLIVDECLARDAQERERYQRRVRVAEALATLTEREREVMQHILAGLLNKQIAEVLSISMKTVEVHRARVFDKMGVKSAVELAGVITVLDEAGSKT